MKNKKRKEKKGQALYLKQRALSAWFWLLSLINLKDTEAKRLVNFN